MTRDDKGRLLYELHHHDCYPPPWESLPDNRKERWCWIAEAFEVRILSRQVFDLAA